MDRCPSERGLLNIHLREGSEAQWAHLRSCADCAERYDRLVEDLLTIGAVLDAEPPPRRAPRWVRIAPLQWVPAACALALLLGLAVSRPWQPRSAAVPMQRRSVSTFADDLSAALFASAAPAAGAATDSEAPYLEAALEVGWPCTADRFLNGDCNDQVSAFVLAEE